MTTLLTIERRQVLGQTNRQCWRWVVLDGERVIAEHVRKMDAQAVADAGLRTCARCGGEIRFHSYDYYDRDCDAWRPAEWIHIGSYIGGHHKAELADATWTPPSLVRCDACGSMAHEEPHGRSLKPHRCSERQRERAEYVPFGDVSRGRLGMQCQYGSRYVSGVRGWPKLGDGLRFLGDPHDYHSLRIHRDDVDEFVRRVEAKRRPGEAQP